MGKIVKVKKNDITLFDGYGYLVRYKESKDIFDKMSDDVKSSVMCKITLAYYLTHSLCHDILYVEKIDSIQKYMIEHPELPYYRWEGCTFIL